MPASPDPQPRRRGPRLKLRLRQQVEPWPHSLLFALAFRRNAANCGPHSPASPFRRQTALDHLAQAKPIENIAVDDIVALTMKARQVSDAEPDGKTLFVYHEQQQDRAWP